MKTSSVEFISRISYPFTYEVVNYRSVCVAPKDLSSLWQWKRRKKRNRFEQTSRTLQRKISMRSTKDQLVKKTFSSGLHGNTAADKAYGQNGRCGMQPKAKHSLRAGAANENRNCGNFELVKVKQKLLDIRAEKERKENARGARAGVTFLNIIVKLICKNLSTF
ncbi:hypothetical protein TNCV_252201 [Trichonephila clavipes]|nr:hypothetical protein TNCV_252201 [Trichonephila clavipes]